MLLIGALVFLFPFWYMVVGAFQAQPDPTVAGAFPDPSTLTVDNFIAINERLNLLVTLRNSLIFTLGVIISTLVLGMLAGYALAVLNFRGRGVVFGIVLLSLILPFQLLMIPLFVMIVRTFGLADTFLGMILPFAVNATAVFIFRQFFLAVPQSLFDAARVDGAGELRILLRVAVPIARPAILTAVLVTFIGPWNEFLWPFLITKQANLQPLGGGTGQLHLHGRRQHRQPDWCHPGGSDRAGHPGGGPLPRFPALLPGIGPGSGRQGLSTPAATGHGARMTRATGWSGGAC